MGQEKSSILLQVAQIAEVVAAAAVVASLLYVGREVRSNTAAIRATSVQAVAEQTNSALQGLAADPVLADIRERGDQDVARLEDSERYRYFLWSRQRWITFQNIYFQQALGVFEPRVWAGYHNIICGVANTAGEVQEWPRHRAALDPEFVGVVEACNPELGGGANH